VWSGYGGRGSSMARIMALSWETVNFTARLPSMNADVDSNRDSNVGAHARTAAPPIRPTGSVAAGRGQTSDDVDAALETDGAGIDGAGVDVVEDVAGGVVVAGAGVAFGDPGLVEADFAHVVGVVAGQGAGEQGFGGGGLAELDVAAGGHDVDLGAVEPIHPFRFADPGPTLVVGVVDAMMAKDVHGMNVATQELADLKAAHQDLAEDIAEYKANTGIEPVDAVATPPEPPRPRRTRKPTK
jgi:hypothetical protein